MKRCLFLAVAGWLLAASADMFNPALHPVSFAARVPAHGPLSLVSHGQPRFVLVSDTQAETNAPYGLVNRPIREAVRTLRREFYFCTGADIPVADVREREKYADRPVVLVGRSALTDALGIEPSKLPPEGFVVTTFSNGVAIVGNDSSIDPDFPRATPYLKLGPRRATLWGVYDFLERFLGCRYYYPGPDGCVRPACQTLVLPPFTYSDAPRFRNRGGLPRGVSVIERTVERPLVDAHVSDFQAASRAASTEPFVSMHSPLPDAWGAAYSNLVDQAFMHNARGQVFYCPTNHYRNYYNVASAAFADLLVPAYVRADATRGRERAGLNYDNARYCVFGQCDAFCPLHVMLAQEEVRREGLITAEHLALGPNAWYADVYGRFYQRLATQLQEKLPGKRLIVLPYGGCVYPPLLPAYRRLPDNVEAGVCLAQMPRFIRNPAVRERNVDILRRWQAALGGRPVRQLWTYNAGNTCFEQAVANEFLPEMIAAFGDSLGDVGLNVDTGLFPSPVPDFAPALHFYYETYCALRAQWAGAAFNAEAALDEHWTLFYGAEGGALLRRLHQTLKEAFLAISVARARSGSLYPEDVLDRIEAELSAARAFFARDRGSVAWRRFRLMSYPLAFELDRQRAIHAGRLVPDPERLRYIQGDE